MLNLGRIPLRARPKRIQRLELARDGGYLVRVDHSLSIIHKLSMRSPAKSYLETFVCDSETGLRTDFSLARGRIVHVPLQYIAAIDPDGYPI
jgi:hypothetical protein